MTPDQVYLLQSSFTEIERMDRDIAVRFYDLLFELAPDMRGLFPDDVMTNWRSFSGTFQRLAHSNERSYLTVPVTADGNREVTLPGLNELAERYIHRGVQPQHLLAARTALLQSFQEHLGAYFDEDVAGAWEAAYDLISGSIISIMRSETTEPALPDARGRTAPEDEKESLDLLFSL